MSSDAVIRRLKADGWTQVRVAGSHHQFKKEGARNVVTVPHPRKDLKGGTLRSIFRAAGWRWLP
jgi:predicted RNA binding protein YcfA (HicA-like mRNA interferase family)